MEQIPITSTRGQVQKQGPPAGSVSRRCPPGVRDDVGAALRADSRSRSVVFRALRLVEEELPAGERGVSVARVLTCRALPKAWDRRVLDLEGSSWDILERLVRAADLSMIWTERTVRAAFLRLYEVCPDLFVRLNHYEYLIPFEELRDPGCARLARLEAWCRDIERQQRERELRVRVRDIEGRRLDRIRQSLASRLRRYGRATAFPRYAPANPDEAREVVIEELARLGPAVEGEGGDRRTFVAACLGEDFGLSPQEFRPLLERWNETCDPPWSPHDLDKKLDSALRNRKRPAGYRLLDAPGTLTPQSGLAPPPRDASAARVWETALLLGDGPALAGIVWAERRGFDPPELLRRDLVRVLSPRSACPRALRVGGVSWLEAGYRLLLPIFDAQGELAGVRGRQIDGPEAAMLPLGEGPLPGAKEIMPAGHRAQGLCFADEAGREMLRGQAEGLREVWIVEGGPDFLTAVSVLGEGVHRGRAGAGGGARDRRDPPRLQAGQCGPGHAVLGIFAGSWTAELAAKIPAGVRVVIATDPDGPGETYARRIAATLAGRCELMRLVLPEGLRDLNAAHCAGRLDLAALRPFEVVQAVPPAAPVALMGCAWDRRALELLNRWPNIWEGPPRELARTLLLCAGQRAPQAAVRGLERALVRLGERGQLPERFLLAAAPGGGFGREQAGSGLKISAALAENDFSGAFGPDFWGEEPTLDRDFKPENGAGGAFGPDFQGEEPLVDRYLEPDALEVRTGAERECDAPTSAPTSVAGAARRELDRNLADMTQASPEVRARLAALRRGRPRP